MKPTCSTCKFWDEKHTSCHAYPPTHDGWPQARVDDWCGEHQPEGIAAQPGEDVFGGGNLVQNGGEGKMPRSQFAYAAGNFTTLGVTMNFQDWRLSAPEIFIQNDRDKEGLFSHWEKLFNVYGITVFNKALAAYRTAKKEGKTEEAHLYYGRMLEFCHADKKVKP